MLRVDTLNELLLRAAGTEIIDQADSVRVAETVKQLLASGAQLNTVDLAGTTAAMKAAERGNLACLHALIDHGKNGRRPPDLSLRNLQVC